MAPPNLKYAKTHEWVRFDGELATVGITDFAVTQLTDLVYVELPAVGTRLECGEVFGEVESVKAVGDLYAPLAGQVVAVNESIAGDLGVLSSDPFGKGWLIKLRVDDPKAVDDLLDEAAYQACCAGQEKH